jgi:uncharacterized protein HemX
VYLLPDNIANIILAIIAALFGAGGIVAYYKAQTDRRKIIEDAEAQHEKIMAEAHDVTSKTVISAFRELTETLQERLDVVTCKVNELETQLERERNRAGVLERKVQMLEREREEWRRERASLIARIAELEACR